MYKLIGQILKLCLSLSVYLGCSVQNNEKARLQDSDFNGLQHVFAFKKGARVRITQSPDADFSHKLSERRDARWAYDASAKVGTPLFATHDGLVTLARDSFLDTDCGNSSYWQKANYLVISWSIMEGEDEASFPEDAESVFLHLQHYSIPQIYKEALANGQPLKVKSGDFIGLSGKSGWTECNAHLHYHVQKKGSRCATDAPWFCDHIKIGYKELNGKLPKYDENYVSLNKGTIAQAIPLMANVSIEASEIENVLEKLKGFSQQVAQQTEENMSLEKAFDVCSTNMPAKDIRAFCKGVGNISTCQGKALAVCADLDNQPLKNPFWLICAEQCTVNFRGFSDFCYSPQSREIDNGTPCRSSQSSLKLPENT